MSPTEGTPAVGVSPNDGSPHQPHPFDEDTQIDRASDRHYRARITDRWGNLVGAPNGGYVLSVCLRALLAEVPFPDPLVLSAYFLRPAVVGEAQVETELVRSGRRLATAEARLAQEGKERVRVVASFCELEAIQGSTSLHNCPPVLPDPSEAVDPLAETSIPGVTIADRVEYRMPELPGWWQGKPSGSPSTEIWARFKEPREPDLLSLPLFVDAAAPVVLELGEAMSSTVELTVHLRLRPAPGFLACRISTRHLINGCHEEDFELWDSEGNLVAQSRQLALSTAPPRK
jgi:acyl-CoA thioesterase